MNVISLFEKKKKNLKIKNKFLSQLYHLLQAHPKPPQKFIYTENWQNVTKPAEPQRPVLDQLSYWDTVT